MLLRAPSQVQIWRRSISNSSSTLSQQVNTLVQQIKSLKHKNHGLFGHSILSTHTGFNAFRQTGIVEADRLVREAISPNRQRKMVQIFDELSNNLCKVADLCEFVRVGHPTPKYAAAAEQSSIAINAEVERLNTNQALYRSLSDVVHHGDIVPTNAIDDYVAKLFLFDFEQCGIHLNEDLRREVVQLNEHILHVGSYFMHGTSKPQVLSRNTTPENLVKYFQLDGNKVVVSGLHNDSSNSDLREFSFKQFLRFDAHQEQLLLELIYSRLKLAKICGFQSFAHRAINGSIAETPNTVWDLINNVNNSITTLTNRDFETMLKLKRKDTGVPDAKLMQWDIPYYTQSHKLFKYNQDIQNASPYFSIGTCMEGLDMVLNSIFNIRLEICDTNQEDLWHPTVMKLAVRDMAANNQVLGHIYCDFFMRSKKPFHDCHFTIQGGCTLSNGDYQNPIVVVFLNFPNSQSNCPTLLNPSMVDNLFHEMGHAIHSMLARTPYQHITGTRCSTDLAEVPSILMENFTSDPRVVAKFAKHYASGKPISEKLLNSWIESKSLFSASDLQLQLFYSALDQVYHSDDPLRGHQNTTDVLSKVQQEYYGVANTESTAWQLRFGHLVGYGAKYYSYLVSKSVANLIWTKLFEKDPLSASAGQIYREKVLVHGGGKPPRDIVESILERPVSGELLASSLVDNIERLYFK